ncbi:MAG: hypothetical protein P8Y97_21290 [Candidatus Lokiarchaeota archaeon]
MAQSISNCEKYRIDLQKQIQEFSKKIEDSTEIKAVSEIKTEWQYKAYARLKASQERKELLSKITKIVTIFNVVIGAITTILSVVLG